MNLEYKTGLLFVRVKNTYLCGMFLAVEKYLGNVERFETLHSKGTEI